MYCHQQQSINWFVYTTDLPNNHPELLKACELGLHLAKRDELINYIIGEKRLNLIAIAGTHGKTTTTAMMVWVFRQLDIPVSFSIGATTSFAPAGHFDPNSRYFVYECDEFDYNFLHFEPDISIITSLDYDHPDTYPTEGDYRAAFERFLTQSKQTVMWLRDTFSGLQTPKNTWLASRSRSGMIWKRITIIYTCWRRLTTGQAGGCFRFRAVGRTGLPDSIWETV